MPPLICPCGTECCCLKCKCVINLTPENGCSSLPVHHVLFLKHCPSHTVSQVYRGQPESTALFCFTIQPPPHQQLANSLCAEVGIQSLRGGGSPHRSTSRYSLLIAQGVNLIISFLYLSLCGSICLTMITIPAA